MNVYIILMWVMLVGVAALCTVCIYLYRRKSEKENNPEYAYEKETFRFRYTLAVCFVLIICCVVGSLTFKYPIQMNDVFVNSSIEIMEKNMEDTATYINEDVQLNYQEMRMMAKVIYPDLDGSEHYSESMLDVLEGIKAEAGFEQVGIIKLDSGYPLATTSDGARVEVNVRWIENPISEGEVTIAYETSPFGNSRTGQDAVVFSMTITCATGEQYMLIAEKPQDALNTILKINDEMAEDEASLVVRENGNVVYGKGLIGGEEFISYNFFSYLAKIGLNKEQIQNIKDTLTKDTYGHVEIQINGENYVIVFHNIEDTDWICVNAYSESYLAGENLAIVNSKTMRLVMLVVLLLLFALVVSVIAVSLTMKRKGEKKVMEKEILFEEMSRCIPSAFAILEAGTSTPEFTSKNLEQVLGGIIPQWSEEGVWEWLGITITKEDQMKFQKEGRAYVVIPKNEKYFAVGVYDIGFVDEKRYHVMVFENVTEEVNARKLLEDSMIRADEASRSKTKFLSKMSHEIRTPLNSIIGFSKLTIDGWNTEKPEELLDFIKKIQISGDYLLDLVSDVLDISRIEEGRMEMTLSPTNLDDVVEEVTASFQGQMKRKNLQFLVDKDYKNVVLNMDAFHTKQILNNLISNSCKYTEEGGCVGFEIHAKQIGAKLVAVQFIVQDTGIGMSPEFLKKIFEPFTQDEDGKRMKNQLRGSGLGMSICKNLVELQNGTIDVESEVGEGSCFTINLTYELVEEIGNTDSGDAEKEVSVSGEFLRGKKVLIVDDIEMNRIIVKKFMDKYGVIYDEAENGQEALEKFEATEDGYFTIFMDIQMPVMNGYEATKAIRKSNHPASKTVPIVAMSADAFSDDVNRALMSGMNYHVAKPIKIERVLKVLSEIENKRGSGS